MSNLVETKEKNAILVQVHELKDDLFSIRVSLRGIIGHENDAVKVCEAECDTVKSLPQLEELDEILGEMDRHAQVIRDQVSRIDNAL